MKLSLVVTTQGKGEGRVIPITLSQFLIGRDPQCQLRPASPVISKRHCAVLVKNGKVYLRDFDSTNGTFLNDQPVKGEVELHNEDRLKVGPLSFSVRMEMTPAVNKPTPPPPAAAAPAAADDDESIAAMLLSLQDDGKKEAGAAAGAEDIPQGSTVMEIPSPLQEGAKDETTTDQPARPGDKKKDTAKQTFGNTQTAAKAILEKYTRRQRS
jgi:pSer/pThr/pTyr-binding forkhead associated (FHA) protein